MTEQQKDYLSIEENYLCSIISRLEIMRKQLAATGTEGRLPDAIRNLRFAIIELESMTTTEHSKP